MAGIEGAFQLNNLFVFFVNDDWTFQRESEQDSKGGLLLKALKNNQQLSFCCSQIG